MTERVAFVWSNFGPLHVDRCESVMERGYEVLGIEFASRSGVYDWLTPPTKFKKVTLFKNRVDEEIPFAKLFLALASACRVSRAKYIFFCHYEKPAVFLCALLLRALGRKVYMMNDSKFDDYPRNVWRELFKRLFFKPYHGCLVAGLRTQDYMRFLGMRTDRIARGYDTISVQRMRTQSQEASQVRTTTFGERHFTIVARLVKKKNHKTALEAYRSYVSQNSNPRPLVICGSGPLEAKLKVEAKSLCLDHLVTFTGFIQTAEISGILSSTLALILPSSEEQFGQVVLEAIAMGLPVVVSEACGARDELVRTGVNGFVFEHNNPEGLAWFMSLLGHDESLWRRMASATNNFIPLCDVQRFADGVEQLMSINATSASSQQNG